MKGWQLYADTFSKLPHIQWPALQALAHFKSLQPMDPMERKCQSKQQKARKAYWRRKAKALAEDCKREGFKLHV